MMGSIQKLYRSQGYWRNGSCHGFFIVCPSLHQVFLFTGLSVTKKVQIPTRQGSTCKPRVRHTRTDTQTDIEILIVRTSITRNTQCYVKLIGTFHVPFLIGTFFLSGGVPPRTPPGKVLGMDVTCYY